MGMINIITGIVTGPVYTGLRKLRSFMGGWSKDINKQIVSAFAIGSILKGFQSVFDKARDIASVADMFEIPVDLAQKLANVSSNFGETFETSRDFLKDLTFNIQNAIDGDENLIESFKRLGVTIDDLESKSLAQIVDQIANSIQRSNDRIRDGNALQRVAGESAGRLWSTLRLGADEMERISSATGVMSAETARALRDANNDLSTLSNRLTIAFAGISKFFLDILDTAALTGVTIFQSFANAFSLVGKQFRNFGNLVRDQFSGIIDIAKAAGDAFTFDFDGAKANFTQGLDKLESAYSKWWEQVRGATASGQRRLRGDWQFFRDELKDIWNPADPPQPSGASRSPSGANPNQEAIAELRAKYTEAEERLALSRMSTEERINTLLEKRNKLLGMENLNTKEGLEAALERIKVEEELDRARAEQAREQGSGEAALTRTLQGYSISADSLARIGGGGNVGFSGDVSRDILSEGKKQTKILDAIRINTGRSMDVDLAMR